MGEPALLFRTAMNQPLTFGEFLGQDWEFAFRARGGDGLVPACEIAVRPFVAAEKDAPVTGLLLRRRLLIRKKPR